MSIALRDDLGDQHGVGTLSLRSRDQGRHGDLGPEVDDLQLAVVLKAFLPRKPLDVQDRVDSDRVGISADAGSDHDQPPPQGLLDRVVDLVRGEQWVVPLDDLDSREVDQVTDPAIDHEEREALPHRMGMGDQRGLDPHLLRQLQGSPICGLGVSDGKRERDLNHPVTGRVAVRPDQLRQARAVGLCHRVAFLLIRS